MFGNNLDGEIVDREAKILDTVGYVAYEVNILVLKIFGSMKQRVYVGEGLLLEKFFNILDSQGNP